MTDLPPEARRKTAREHIWTAAGFVCMGLAGIGFALPLMPGFVFLLAALACFGRGSPRMRARLLQHPRFGPPLRDFAEHRVIRRKIKRTISLGVLSGLAVTYAFVWPRFIPLAAITLILGGVLIYVWTRAEQAPEGPGD